MGKLSNIFGKKPPPPRAQDAISELREVEERLLKREAFLDKKIQDETLTARQNANSNRRLALQALKRKKLLEKQRDHVGDTINTLACQRATLENTTVNTEIMHVLADANKTLKVAHGHMDVDQVQELMEDISEQQDVSNEICAAISNPIGQEWDESELMAELEDLEQETLEQQLITTGPTPSVKLPAVPMDALPKISKAPKAKLDDELAELEQWAA